MTNPIFRRYGPGLLYGRNTIMAYLDDLTRINCKAVDQLTPSLNNQPKGKRHDLIDELKELEEIRAVLKKSFTETLEIEPPKFPKIIEQTLPKLEAPFHILRDVIIPIIEQISTKTPESIPQFLETMNEFLTNNAPTEVWDVPEVSERVTQWMKKALIMPNCDQASILQFWLKFIKLRAKIEDVLVLASVWFEHKVPDDKLTLIPMLLSDIKLEVSKCTFLDFIENTTSPLTVSYNPIMIENLRPPSSLSEQPKRKCVAHGGFLYVMDSDPKIGFSKFGNGKCGTIFGQTEIISKEFANRNPVSLAFCNELILVRFADSPSNEIIIIDPATLKEIGRVENAEILPSGPFTAFKNTFYVVYQKSINSYSFDGKSLKFIKTTEINLTNGQTEFIPDSKLALANLFTDGIFMNVVFTPKDDSSASVISCSLETGDFIDTPPANDIKLSPYISFDSLAKTLIMIPNWTQTSIYNYSERYNFQILFGDQGSLSSPSNNACLNLLDTIIPSSISKISPGIINYNRHYVLSNAKPLYELIELCFKDERYSVFLQPSVILLTIRISQVEENPLITLDVLCSILISDKVTSTSKIALLKSLIKHGNTPLFNTLDKCNQILQHLNDQEITEIFTDTGFNDIFTFAMAFLIKPYDRVLNYAAENSKKAYPFISNLIFTILRGVLVKKCFSPTVIFPILEITTKCDKSILPTIVPPLLPLIEQATSTILESKKYTDILLSFTSNLLQYASIIDLQSFANFHAESREKPKYFTKTTVEESPHPYDNEMRVVHHYDFPGAVELVIEFDKRTATENGCDYLQIFTDEEMKKELTPMMSGKYSKWTPMIKTNSQHLTFHFYSDTSITEWGYRATITAKYVATRKFSSPESFFDLSYSIIDMLYNFTKRLIDEKRTKQSYPQFNIPKEVIYHVKQLSESQKMDLKTKLKGQIDDDLFNLPTTLPSFYSTIDYLVNNNMFDKSLVDIMLSPPDYIITESQDPKEIFTSLASFIMTNNLCELPQARFSFLTSVIQGTDDAHVFSLNLIKKAQDVLQDSNPKNLLSAANYIQTAFKIDSGSIQKEGKDVISKFLNTLSHSCLPLNMPLASSLIEKSHNLFTIVLPSLTNVAQFLQKACDSLDSIEPNEPDKTIPFINFALSVILVLDPDESSKPFITRLILSSLKFNMPNTIPLISQAAEKFNIHTNLKESPILNEIFGLIGKGFSTEKPTPTNTIRANLSPSLMIARAAILRRLIEPDSISDLTPIIEKQDEASFGALLVLSQRFLPPFPSQRVRLISNNKVVTLTGMDYQSYHMKTDSGVDFSIPAANYGKFVFFNPPFIPILPSEFPPASKELVSAVEKCITNANSEKLPFSLIAKCALSELSFSSPIDSKLIKWPSLAKPTECRKHEVIETTTSHFKHETGQNLYRMNTDTNCVTFIAQGQMTVGFSAKNSLSSAFIAPIRISNNYINFENGGIKFHFESPEVTIGLFGPYKQVFIQSGKMFSFTQLFLGSLEDPQPFFLTEEIPQLVVPKDFPSFLFYTKHAKSFSHVHSGERLYSINDDLYKPKKLSELHFLPPLKTNRSKYVYLEISTSSRVVSFSLINETIKAHILYQNELSGLPERVSKTVGIFISFPDAENNKQAFAFMTYEGNYVESSVAKINMTEQVSLVAYFNETIFTSVNTGTKPFVFDVDEFISKFRYENLPIKGPLVDSKRGPTEISSIVCSEKEPEDFLQPSNKFRSVPLERPIFIPSHNIVTSYVPSTQKESSDYTIDVYSDYISREVIKSDKIISLTESLTTKKAQSIAALERIQNSMPQYISPFLFFKSDKREEMCQNLLTKKRKDAYFDNINNEALFSTALNTISRFSAEQIDSFDNFEQFIINSASALTPTPFALLNGEFNLSYGNALRNLYDKKPSLFEKLAKKALYYLVNEPENASTIVLSNSDRKQIDISRTGSDFIYLRILPQSVIRNVDPQIKGLNIDGRKSVLEINTQELFDGSLFTIQNIKNDEILYIKLIPINLHESPLTFSLQMINFMLETKETWNLLHSEILYPLFSHVQSGYDIFFPSTYSLWFNKSFINRTISREMMIQYSNSINLYQVGNLCDELCTSLLLFGLYCHTNSVKDENDLNLVRERTVNYLDTLVSVKENFSSYTNNELYSSLSSKGISFSQPPFTPSSPSLTFEGIILRISMALISPFGNKLQFLGLVGKLDLPVMTTAAFIYSKNSQYSPQSITINLDDAKSPISPIVIDDDHFEGVYLKLNKKIQEGIVFVNDNCIRESQAFYYQKSKTDANKKIPISIRVKKFDAILHIIPIYQQTLPTVNDFTKLYQYYNELKQKLTYQIDSDLVSISQNLVLNNIHIASLLDDNLLRRLYPSISPEAIRYRISCHIISIMKDGSCIRVPTNNSTGFCSLQHSLGSVVVNKKSKFSNSNNYNVNDRIERSSQMKAGENIYGMLPEFVLKRFENGETDYNAFFSKFLNLVESVPMRLRANAPTKMTNSAKSSSSSSSLNKDQASGASGAGGDQSRSASGTQTNDQDQDEASGNSSSLSASLSGSPQLSLSSFSSFVITKYLRASQNKLFEEKEGGFFVPRKDATDKNSIDAFQGFGSLLGLRFVSGRSPPLPVSRFVLKAAFGGVVTQDDLEDSNMKMEDLDGLKKQLEAIKIGVELAVPMASSIVPSEVFARVFQIAPRIKSTVLNIAVPEELTDPLLFPSLRRAVLSSHVKFQPEDKQRNMVLEIFQNQTESLNDQENKKQSNEEKIIIEC